MRKKKKTKRKASTLTLPTEKSVPSNQLWDYLIFVYGVKKIGKTTMFAHADNAFYAMFEPGGKALSIYQRPCPTWSKFVKYVDLLEQDDTFNPVVIDTVDLAYDACMERVCFKMGIDHPSDVGFAKAWKAVKREFIFQLARLAATGKGLVLISHATEKEIETRSGTYQMIAPTLSGQALDVMDKIVDIWAEYDYFGEDRYLQILGDDSVSAGHRLEHRFKYTDGSPIRYIPCGTSSKQTWENFVAAFDNELDRPDEEPVRVQKKKKTKRKSKRRT